MVTLAFYNLKGGVGKTAAAVNLAYLAAKEGKKTLVWDLDPQGSASFYLAVTPGTKNESKKILLQEMDIADAVMPSAYEHLSVIPADLSARYADVLLNEMKQFKKKFAALINSFKKEYDLVMIDCPPGLSILHEAIFFTADWILMPNIPTTLSIRSFETVLQYFKDNDLNIEKIKCFFSMVDHRKNLHHETMNEFYKDKLFLKNYIPYLSDIEKMGIHQAPLETYAANTYAAQCFRDVWKEIKRNCL
ncbi:MAG: AAA family ATPase [Hydrotalea flava]|uniref:ParA family protein n=1 Tax=Hydrotalea TaxID=1004300 RepID=UPI0010259900|nr:MULTISPECIES: AAA family ATPase [Hydrotalea]MBY0346699.1 AAA family ATPase [Hydrotalea flava]NIM34670.1 AAA family ATPase [Hydrotalea flava]NIM37505.1 AAA family ATPase [Hydrotalea flava]NIN02677.1 AAA family ATPase [Hydrotalea flava]NIN14348.1 AAA family ATPase [Hydrotalea flava]